MPSKENILWGFNLNKRKGCEKVMNYSRYPFLVIYCFSLCLIFFFDDVVVIIRYILKLYVIYVYCIDYRYDVVYLLNTLAYVEDCRSCASGLAAAGRQGRPCAYVSYIHANIQYSIAPLADHAQDPAGCFGQPLERLDGKFINGGSMGNGNPSNIGFEVIFLHIWV